MNDSQKILKYTYGLVPIVAGLDKFSNILTDWKQYIAPPVSSLLPVSPSVFMMIVGVIEIVAGILVLLRPKTGGIVVMSWLILIALTLIIGGQYVDVAVRDLVMAVGALVLVKLSGLPKTSF